MRTTHCRALRALVGLAAVTTLAACGSGETTSTTTASSSSAASTSTPSLTVTDGWVKAVDASQDMTAAFGTLTNTGDEDVVITGGRSDLAGMVEAHVMSKDENGAMVMEEAKDGDTVPAGGALELTPGGAHLMLMDLSSDVVAGEDYVVTVTTADGQEVDLTFAGREFSGAEEEYAPDMPGMSHDGHGETPATSSSSR